MTKKKMETDVRLVKLLWVLYSFDVTCWGNTVQSFSFFLAYTSRGTGGSRTWKSRAMDVFKKYWHVMKEKSELTRQTLNDDIDNEVQRLKHINQMCRKMSRAARRIGLNYNSLIDSEQMFHDILNEPNDQNDSLTEDFCNTSALQQDVITVEEGLKCMHMYFKGITEIIE